MVVKIEVRGAEDVRRILKKVKKNIPHKVKKGMGEYGLTLKDEVQSSIEGNRTEPRSVDTGRFLHSIGFKQKNMNINVFSTVPYAKFLEYGTSQINARRHFLNSFNRLKPLLKIKMKEALKKSI